MRRPAVVALSAVLALGSLPALGQGSPPGNAQDDPSADQVIKSLTPSGNLGTTRGIRLAHPGTAPPPQAATSSAPAAPSVNLSVLFATNSAGLTPEAIQTMDDLGHALMSQQLTPFRFRVVGHTDTVGTPAYNMELSRRRANAVVAYLEQKFNIPANRLEALGVGETGLLVPTAPQTPEARNRRVQVINLGT